MKLRAIEVGFPVEVELPDGFQQRLCELISEVCREYEVKNPNRVMGVFGVGQKITYAPMTREEEESRGMEYDESTLQIEVAERENYNKPKTQPTPPQQTESN